MICSSFDFHHFFSLALSLLRMFFFFFFFFNDTATTEIYTLSLHDALPISNFLKELQASLVALPGTQAVGGVSHLPLDEGKDRKSTRLNSSHVAISYAVFCLKKKKKKKKKRIPTKINKQIVNEKTRM